MSIQEMTGTVKLHFVASNLKEAREIATDQWRVIVGNAETELPWSTEFTFFRDLTSSADMAAVDVDIELDGAVIPIAD